jgi:hypothetical protein
MNMGASPCTDLSSLGSLTRRLTAGSVVEQRLVRAVDVVGRWSAGLAGRGCRRCRVRGVAGVDDLCLV